MNDLRAECIARLQTVGLRPSEPRIAVLAFLMKNRIHPVAETIYKSLAPEYPTLSRTTVYNTLKLFEENKIVMPLTIEDGELRYDINTSFHGHFKCRKCHIVTDISTSTFTVSAMIVRNKPDSSSTFFQILFDLGIDFFTQCQNRFFTARIIMHVHFAIG